MENKHIYNIRSYEADCTQVETKYVIKNKVKGERNWERERERERAREIISKRNIITMKKLRASV